MQSNFADRISLKILPRLFVRTEIVMRVLIRGLRSVRAIQKFEDAALLSWKMEEKTVSQGM